MKKMKFFSLIIFALVIFACQNETSTNAETTTSVETNAESDIATENGSTANANEESQVLKENPILTDGETRVIDIAAMKKPEIKSVGGNTNITTSVKTPKEPKSQKDTKKEKPAQKPKKQVVKEQVTQEKPTAITIEPTQPVVVGSATRKSPAPKIERPKDDEIKIVETPQAKPTPPAFSHDAWDQLLKSNVSASGKVNYKGFKSKQAALDAYLKTLADNPIQDNWGRNKKMAYWINAYNAFTIKLIVNNYPLAKITDLEGGKPWDKKWIKLGGKTYSLNNIENDILRPQYNDARIHFAVNCAAKSCPPLLNRAWTASNLNSNFEKQAKAFINNSNFNKVGADEVELSKIFEWYAVDFGDLLAYLNKYANTKINPKAKISYMEYNWNLNE